jgi:hypothetical protein
MGHPARGQDFREGQGRDAGVLDADQNRKDIHVPLLV